MPQKIFRPISLMLTIALVLLNVNVPTAQARMIGTQTVIAEQERVADRELVDAFLAREDVQEIMTQYGVDVSEAQQRVDSLSPAELQNIANSMDSLPAGGDAVGAIVGAAVLIFIVLLITDILGFTHVFTFVNPQN
ncbi:MAG: PA2779 family protein [Desulfuromonadales bacterium]